MRIYVDKQNKCIVATGHYRGKKIKAVARCKEDDFDEAFGTELVKKKYKIKKEMIKKDFHNSCIKKLHQRVLWCFNQIKYEEEVTASLVEKLDKQLAECNYFIDNHFKTN